MSSLTIRGRTGRLSIFAFENPNLCISSELLDRDFDDVANDHDPTHETLDHLHNTGRPQHY